MVTPQPRTGTRLGPVLARGVLAWRDRYLASVRRHPLIVDAALVAVLLKLSGPHFTGIRSSSQAWSLALLPALLLVAFYTIAVYEPPRRILAAAAILEAGAVLFAAQNARGGTHAILVWVSQDHSVRSP